MTRLNEAKADLAAPEHPEEKTCTQCLMAIHVGDPACGDPLCPLSEPLESGEAADNPELARANLCRIRGDLKGARDVCLSILKRRPGNLTAHVLLGDLCAEEGDLVHAAEWYELALDLDRNDGVIVKKVTMVRERVAEREAAEAARQLGLPTTPQRAKWFAIGTAVLIVAVGLVAFLIGDRFSSNRKSPQQNHVVTLPSIGGVSDEVATGTSDNSTGETSVTDDSTHENPAPQSTESELLAGLKSQVPEGARIVSANMDEATKCLTIRANAVPTESLKLIAAQLGVGALRSTDAVAVLVQLCSGNDILFLGEIDAAKAKELIDADGAGRDPLEADLDTLFRYSWPGARE